MIFELCSKINSSTEQTEANLSSAIFQSARVFVQRLAGDVLFSTFVHHKWNFVVRVADWTNDSFARWNFVARAPDWLKQNQCEFYSLWFSWINLSTFEINFIAYSFVLVSFVFVATFVIKIKQKNAKSQTNVSNQSHWRQLRAVLFMRLELSLASHPSGNSSVCWLVDCFE